MRGLKCPWLTIATKKLINEHDTFLRKARESGSKVDWNIYRRLRNKVCNSVQIQEILVNPKSFLEIFKDPPPPQKKEKKKEVGKLTPPQSIKTDEWEIITDIVMHQSLKNSLYSLPVLYVLISGNCSVR